MGGRGRNSVLARRSGFAVGVGVYSTFPNPEPLPFQALRDARGTAVTCLPTSRGAITTLRSGATADTAASAGRRPCRACPGAQAAACCQCDGQGECSNERPATARDPLIVGSSGLVRIPHFTSSCGTSCSWHGAERRNRRVDLAGLGLRKDQAVGAACPLPCVRNRHHLHVRSGGDAQGAAVRARAEDFLRRGAARGANWSERG
jgi:hypothetical protein